MAVTEIPSEFPLQGSAGQHIQIGIDSFMRDAHRRVVRIPLRQAVRNLFGRPAVREQVQDGGAQARAGPPTFEACAADEPSAAPVDEPARLDTRSARCDGA